MECMKADPLLVDILYMACNRHVISKSYYEGVPAKDRPTREILEGYTSYYVPEEDFAWSELYPELCMWLADYNRRRNKEAGEDDDGEIRIKF